MFRRYDFAEEVWVHRESKGLSLLPVISIIICFVLTVEDMSSQLPAPTPVPFAVVMANYLPGTISPNKLFLL